MKDQDLRKTIGSRIKQRRTELNLHQKYIAEKMDVNTSTIQRYEAGTEARMLGRKLRAF